MIMENQMKKIDLYRKANQLDGKHATWIYVFSTLAYKSCRDAVSAAKAKYPAEDFKANFAR